jgi:CBS domain-containing protein
LKTAEDIILDKINEIVSVTKSQTVAEAIDLMNRNKIGAILVQEDDDMVGIWTERDYLRGSSDPAFDPKSARIGDHMTSPLHFAPHDATLTQLEEMFLGLYVRHLPVKKDERVVGMVSIGDVLRANLLAKDRQIKELNSMASWQYYENWGWDRQKS